MSSLNDWDRLLADRVSAVVVEYHSGDALFGCVESLRTNGVRDIVVVDNSGTEGPRTDLHDLNATVVVTGVNLGYGRGINRGASMSPRHEFLLVTNPDVVVHEGAVKLLLSEFDANSALGVIGPTILRTDGTTYPSVRVFPNVLLAALHAVLSPLWPNNEFSRRYRSPRSDGHIDWVSGAFFVIRRELFERIGGFDERYFMFGEDMDLCWRAQRAHAQIGTAATAVVTHVEGVSRQRAPRSMLIAHHRGVLGFEWRTASLSRRVLFPCAVVVVFSRLAAVLLLESWHSWRRGQQ